MGRGSAKENKSRYHLRREELGLTREEPCERFRSISPDRLERLENEKIALQPEDVLEMAEAYKAPELCNYYCAHDCPIGQKYVPEIEIKDLSQIVLEMVASLNAMHKQQERLIEITVDGEISSDEIKDFVQIRKELDRISIAVDALKLWTEQMLSSGAIDKDAYEVLKDQI